MVIITNIDGNEEKFVDNYSIDIDLNKTMDFELEIPSSRYNDSYGYYRRMFIPNTEYGGIFGSKKISTTGSTVTIGGLTWRGYLYKHIIRPLEGEDYRIVSGELNDIIRSLIEEAGIEDLFVVPDIDTGIEVNNFQFYRYTTLLRGLDKLCESEEYKIELKYIQGERGDIGYVQLQAVPVVDFSPRVELSQDYNLEFTLKENINGINHLICLGQGELKDRQVLDLYLQEDGTIGHTQYYTGIRELAEIYDYPNVESIEDLEKYGIERFKEVMSQKTIEVDLDINALDVQIGDIIGGRDYVTGASLSKPVKNKIYKEKSGVVSVEYSITGEESTPEIQ